MKIPRSLVGGRIVPHYLRPEDHVWLSALLDEYRRFEGRRRRELTDRLRSPLPVACPELKLQLAMEVLDRIWRSHCHAPVSPRKLRADVFQAAADGKGRRTALKTVGDRHQLHTSEIMDLLFADIPEERRLRSPDQIPTPHELGLQANLLLLTRLLSRASHVNVRLAGNARAVVRYVRLRGLLCSIRAAGLQKICSLQVSGPYEIFRHTRIYGRTLAGLLPVLKRCEQFELRARCHGLGTSGTLVVRTLDPLPAAAETEQYDSKVEERFARDFARQALDWDVSREPEPVTAGDNVIFPDFALTHRHTGERWLLEIIGFWTPDYLRKKLGALRAARLSKIILCVDRTLNCSDSDLPASARIVHYRRWVKPADVLCILCDRLPNSPTAP